MAIRVTRISAAVSGTTDNDVRVTRVSAAVSGTPDAALTRIHRIGIQILANVPPDVQEAVASNSLQFSSTASTSLKSVSNASNLVFQGSVGVATPREVSSVNSLQFTNTSVSSLKTPSVVSGVIFGQNVTRRVVDKAAVGNLVFSQTPQKVHIKASATDHAGTSALVFSNTAKLSADAAAVSTLQFSNTAAADKFQELTSELVFSQSSSTEDVKDRTSTSDLVFSHQFFAEEKTISLCEYNPQIGGGTISSGLTRYGPDLGPAGKIVLSYPVSSPTHTVTLRVPEFGNRQRFAADRIFRESASGALEVFREDGWPTQETIGLQVIATKETVGQDYLTLVTASLGKEIRFDDHEGRSWRAIITSTSDPIIRNVSDLVDISIELFIVAEI